MPDIQTFTTHEAAPGLLAEIRALLDGAFSGRFSDDDWDHTLGGTHVTVSESDVVVAHAAVVERALYVDERPFRTGYLEGVGTAPGSQGSGFGSLAVARVTEEVRDGYELGALSTDRHTFYQRLGWERWQGPTFVGEGSGRRRTEEEDDGIMVLRIGPSADIDLTAPLTCEARRGDDW